MPADINIHYQRSGTGCPLLYRGGIGGNLRGDPGAIDADSYITLLGHLKELINRGG